MALSKFFTDKVTIFDTTLRDGEQTHGVSLIPGKKLVITKQLDKLGVGVIEAEFPVVSKGEMRAINLLRTKEEKGGSMYG